MTNQGSRTTPFDRQADPIPTHVTFACDGQPIAVVDYPRAIDPDETVRVTTQPSIRPTGRCLLSARANADQFYVELHGLDDNSAYTLSLP